MANPITPPIEALRAEVFTKFPEARNLGVYLRRPISGTNTWSQHAYGNALDIGVPLRDSGYRLDWGGAVRTVGWGYDVGYGNAIRAWLVENGARFPLGTVLWRISRHYDHLHVEGSPKKYGTPPYPSPSPAPAPVPPPPPIGEEIDLARLPLLREGARGGQVAILQGLLLAHGHSPGGLLNASGHPDGDFGPGTAAEVRRFQTNHGLADDGIVGSKTWTQLLGL